MKKENYILCAGLILCGVILSNQALDRSMLIRHISWGLTTLMLCVCLLVKKKKNLSVLYSTLFLVMIVYCLAATLSMFKAVNVSESLYVTLIAWTTLIFFVCTSATIDKKIVTKAMVYFGLFMAVYGLFSIGKAMAGRGITQTTGLGFTCGRNMWSSTLLLLLPFSLYDAFTNRNKWAILTAILLVVNMIFLQTRSVYLALIIATAISLGYRKRFVILLIALFVISFLCSSKLTNTHSLSYRLQKWNRSAKAFYHDPMFGVGAGNWKITIPLYSSIYTYKDGGRAIHYQRAHNDFIEVFTETGIFGGLAYMSIFAIALYYSHRARDKILAWAMRFGIISYIVIAFFSYPKERAIHSMLIFTMIALLVKDYPIRKEWSERINTKTLAICAVILSFALFVNYQRYRTEIYCRQVMYAKSQYKWQKVIDLIDENYTPFSTILSYSVTPIKWYQAEAKLYLGQPWLEDMEKANELHPNHPFILSMLGLYNSKTGNTEKAITYYEHAQKIRPNDLRIKKNLDYVRGL